jgi:cobalt-zinc-cadmium resistance protein CzcA
VIGGVIGAMIMSLLVLRVLYLVFNAAFERGGSSGPREDTAEAVASEEAARPVGVL